MALIIVIRNFVNIERNYFISKITLAYLKTKELINNNLGVDKILTNNFQEIIVKTLESISKVLELSKCGLVKNLS